MPVGATSGAASRDRGGKSVSSNVPKVFVCIATALTAATLSNLATAQEPVILEGPKGAVSTVAFSPDGRTLAAAQGARLYLWDLRNQELLLSVWTETGNRSGRVAFSPDGKMIAFGDTELTVRDAKSGKKLLTFGRQDKG
jgi:WD40 repeat protein